MADKEKSFQVPHSRLKPIMDFLGRQNRGEIPFAGRPQTIQDLFGEEAQAHELYAPELEHHDIRDGIPDSEEITLFDSMATGYFSPEAVLQRQIAKVRFDLQKESGKIE